jgi:hypothetical protein
MKFLIAHISPPGSKNNNSYNNYYIEKCKININENMLWDDNKQNTLTIGDFVIFYCWGKRVEIHKVINFTDDLTKRRAHWDKNECNVLYLSPCLNIYSFKNFGTYDPPYSVYKQGFKKKNAYDLHNYPKLQNELNGNKEITQINFDINAKIHHSQFIKNYYTMLSEQENIWGSNGFISISYRSDGMQNCLDCFKHNLFENVETICRLIKKNEYLNDKNSLYKVCKLVMDDYKKILLQYCIGIGQEEKIFNDSKDLMYAVNLFCEDVSKSNKIYGNPCNWWSKDWDNYDAGNSYEFSN